MADEDELAKLREENEALKRQVHDLQSQHTATATRAGYVSLVCLALGFYGATLVVAPDEAPARARVTRPAPPAPPPVPPAPPPAPEKTP